MHTSKDDYLINSLRFVSAKESSQIFGAILPECLTSPTMKESKAYKTYIGYATGEVPPKIARKFKKASPTKKDSDLVPVDEEPIRKGKRVKRSVKKSSTKPAIGIVIREPSVETKSKGKEKEMVDVARVKGIELLSEVALTEKAQLKEVRKKSLRDFHKTHPSGSGTGAKKPPSVENITPTVTSEETSDKLGVPDVIEDDSTKSESESWGNDEDDSNNEQEANDEGSRQENESEEQESDSEQDEESDDDNQEEEEVDQENESEDDEIENARLEEPTQTGKEVVQGEGADVEMNEAQQGNENLVTTQEQFEVDIIKKTENQAKMTKLSMEWKRLCKIKAKIIGHLYNQGFLFSSRAFYWLKPRNCLSAATAPASAVGRLSIHLVALIEEAQMKEVRKKSLRDFHKTHLSSSATMIKIQVMKTVSKRMKIKIKYLIQSKKKNLKMMIKKRMSLFILPLPLMIKMMIIWKSESDDVNKSDEESDDVFKGDKEIVQGKGVDAEMINAQQGNEKLETTQEQVVEYAHVIISTITKKTKVPITSSSHSSDLASKFLFF
ncbi:hypothetical protein Tco_0299581 [Tanacetum coccineum]